MIQQIPEDRINFEKLFEEIKKIDYKYKEKFDDREFAQKIKLKGFQNIFSL